MAEHDDSGFYDDLDGTLEEAWRMLEDGVVDRRAPFHTPTVASLSLDGAPSARTVVLRRVSWAERWLQAHTDRRSEKAREVLADPRVSLHFYDPRAKVQLRIGGLANLYTEDAVAEEAWARSCHFSRECYRIEPGPGTPLADPHEAVIPQVENPEAGREHFAVLRVRAQTLEWLYLAARGHRRARFDWNGEEMDARWLTP